MRLVFMGTPDFAVPSLQALLDAGHEVVAVFTQPDKPKGRGFAMTPPPVKVLAAACGIPVHQPQKLRDGAAAALLRELQPDCIIVVAYGRILPREILEIPPRGCINVHGSLLPKYRGAAPIQWAVLSGDAEAGVTTMYMAEGLDTGDMLLRVSTPVGEDETSGELFDRLSLLGGDCLVRTLALLEAGELTPQPQREEDATHAPMLERSMAPLDFTKPAQALHNQIRGLNPWPSATTTLDGKLLKIHRSRVVEDTSKGDAPGELLEDRRFLVACGEGALELLEVQLEGKARSGGAEFLRGRRLQAGYRFPS